MNRLEKENCIPDEYLARPGQSLYKHLMNVSKLSQLFGDKSKIGELMRIAGFLHDMGKATPEWQEYLNRRLAGEKIHTEKHSIFGAKCAYEKSLSFLPVAEILSNIIASHHGSLRDSISPNGDTPLKDEQAECTTFPAVDSFDMDMTLFEKEFLSVINAADAAEKPFFVSMLIKLAYSCLVDADRLDAYLSEIGGQYYPSIPDWEKHIHALERHLEKLAANFSNSSMTELRRKVADDCAKAGLREIGIYKLEVPTGGGKTLSSLRFALRHAQNHRMDRIIYVIPYLSILSQTAQEIRQALEVDDDIVLEHHSNFLPDNEEYYKLHTDRWDASIILTTQVQFLESIFSAKGSDLRKFHNMANSVMIFDEAQSIPIKCIHIFNTAMNFINSVCKSTILLCTATQPPFDAVEKKMNISLNPSLTDYLPPPKRYEIIDLTTPMGYTYPELAAFVRDKHHNSTLVILNTKATAKALYQELNELGLSVLHLSTNMCSAHRDDIIAETRKRLDEKTPVICVSTQLIEAGVDISFECVVRDIAGLDSIYQAAGRCNRHGEFEEIKNVYVINIKGENLSRLPDIKTGSEITKRLFYYKNDDMNKYYEQYFYSKRNEMDYDTENGTIYDMLSGNLRGCGVYRGRKDKNIDGMKPPALRQALRSAAEDFYIIERGRKDLLVIYKDSETLLHQYLKTDDLIEKRRLLKKLGKYSVSLFQYQLKLLESKGVIDSMNYGGLTVLSKGFYNEYFGFDYDGEHELLCV